MAVSADGTDDEFNCKPLYALEGGYPNEGKGVFKRPFGLCCGADGSMAVADTYNHQVQFWDASGRLISALGDGRKGKGPQEMKYPFDLCYLSPPPPIGHD